MSLEFLLHIQNVSGSNLCCISFNNVVFVCFFSCSLQKPGHYRESNLCLDRPATISFALARPMLTAESRLCHLMLAGLTLKLD